MCPMFFFLNKTQEMSERASYSSSRPIWSSASSLVILFEASTALLNFGKAGPLRTCSNNTHIWYMSFQIVITRWWNSLTTILYSMRTTLFSWWPNYLFIGRVNFLVFYLVEDIDLSILTCMTESCPISELLLYSTL